MYVRGSCRGLPLTPHTHLDSYHRRVLPVQTCEVGSRCPFTQGLHTLDLDLEMCEEAFGITPDQVREQVRLTNLFYGGDRPRYYFSKAVGCL